jgi:hypothetical protein
MRQPIDRPHLPLAATTRYDYGQVHNWFAIVGLRVCWENNLGSVGVFLLRRM